MLIIHHGHRPNVDPSAYVAPNALLCGDVTVGPGTRIMFGAQVVAEGGTVAIGAETIVMENAVLRATPRHNLVVGNNCVVGPNAHLAGCHVDSEVFIATGAAVFHGARLGRGSEVRINAVVHLRTHVSAGETVPIGWVAVGNPAQLFPPDQHEKIWAVQKPLDFPMTVYGFERAEADMIKITGRMAAWLGSHKDDRETE